MKPTKIMIIRHAEKPGTYESLYGDGTFGGVDQLGAQNPDSLVTLGWERGGGIANLFFPSGGRAHVAGLAKPDFLYASNPDQKGQDPNKKPKRPSRRPYETLRALSKKTGMAINVASLDNEYPAMITEVLALDSPGPSCTVLIAWQHQDILPEAGAPFLSSLVGQLIFQTDTTGLANVPVGPWPMERYDMVFVFDRPGGVGPFTFTQVPQLLLAGDSPAPIRVFNIESVASPGVFLRLNGEHLKEPNPAGAGKVNCQFTPAGPWEQFRIVDVFDGSGTVNIESVAFPGIFLRMDATGLSASNPVGGTVNCQVTAGPFERFRTTDAGNGNMNIESVAFPGVSLRMNGEGIKAWHASGAGEVNGKFTARGPLEQFCAKPLYVGS